jgi:hypothetical protein
LLAIQPLPALSQRHGTTGLIDLPLLSRYPERDF